MKIKFIFIVFLFSVIDGLSQDVIVNTSLYSTTLMASSNHDNFNLNEGYGAGLSLEYLIESKEKQKLQPLAILEWNTYYHDLFIRGNNKFFAVGKQGRYNNQSLLVSYGLRLNIVQKQRNVFYIDALPFISFNYSSKFTGKVYSGYFLDYDITPPIGQQEEMNVVNRTVEDYNKVYGGLQIRVGTAFPISERFKIQIQLFGRSNLFNRSYSAYGVSNMYKIDTGINVGILYHLEGKE